MIGHVDGDCFYVSAERVRHPWLNGMPVGVIGNHGACIIAKSYELKAYGVYTGMPIWEAKEVCPDAIYIKRDFRLYDLLTHKMLAAIKSISPRVEFYSVDEQFFATTENSHSFLRDLQQTILEQVGVPVSIGLAHSKTLAKLVTKAYKPFGYGLAIDDGARIALLRDRPVTDICGIAQRNANRLASYGIQTCEQLANADRRFVRRILHKSGEDLWYELNGDPVKPILTKRPAHKFVSRGGSIGLASRDVTRVRAFVVRNVERLVEALAYYHYAANQFSLEFSFQGHPDRAWRCSLMGSRTDFESFLQAAYYLLPRVWQPRDAKVHYMHVVAGDLCSTVNRQLSLFDQSPVADIKRIVNNAVGRFAVRSAATLPLTDVYADPANEFDICDIPEKTCF
ncbi:MAG: nucleotidyltransferase [Bythopirellula sp.]|nr:nucleotidyltransferase [Bythopirellula sp.]